MSTPLWAIQGREKPTDEWEFCQSLDVNHLEIISVFCNEIEAYKDYLEWAKDGEWEYRIIEVEVKENA